MSINSRDKRSSILMMGLGFGRVFPNPIGVITTADDRYQIAFSYGDDFNSGYVKVRIGTTWYDAPLKVYVSSLWQDAPLKAYVGSTWDVV